MKIKYSFSSFQIIHYSILIVSIPVVIDSIIKDWDFIFLLPNILFIFELLYIPYIHIITPVILSSDRVIKKSCFFNKSIEINKNTSMEIKPLFGILRKRLFIITEQKRVVLWDFYNISLEKIIEDIYKIME